MHSPSHFPRTTKLRHIIVGLLLCSGYYHVNQLGVHNAYLNKNNEFPRIINTYNQDMHFVMERPSQFDDKTLQIKVYLNDKENKSFPVICHKEGCMDFISEVTMRYKPTEITTFQTPFGDELLRSVIYTDRESGTETLFKESETYLDNYYKNIKLKLGSYLVLHFLFLGLVGFTLYPNKSFAKDIRYTQTLQELVVLCGFTYLLYYQSKLVFLNIPLTHIEYYPVIAAMFIFIVLLVLFASENIIVLYDRSTGDVKVVPSSFRYETIKSTFDSAKRNLNIALVNSEGKFRRRKFDELPDLSNNPRVDEGYMEVENKKTSRTIDTINSTIEFQGEKVNQSIVQQEVEATNPNADIISILIGKVKNKIGNLRKGQYETQFEKKAVLSANKQALNSQNQIASEKKYFSFDELTESDNFDHNDLDPEILKLMSPPNSKDRFN